MKNKLLAEYIKPVRLLSLEETRLMFKDNPILKLCFTRLRNYQYNGKIFGFDLIPSLSQINPPCSIEEAVKLFVIPLEKAAERANYIFETNQKEFDLQALNIPNFSVSQFLGARVSFGYKYLEDLVNSFNANDFNKTRLNIESQYFHEQIHHLGFCKENLPLFGEFLYDPKNNSMRNSVFAQHSQDLGKTTKTESLAPYINEWRNASILLLKEYTLLNPTFRLPQTHEKQIELVTSLPKLYEHVSKKDRDKIMKKYIHYNADAELPVDNKIEEIASDYAKELRIKY